MNVGNVKCEGVFAGKLFDIQRVPRKRKRKKKTLESDCKEIAFQFFFYSHVPFLFLQEENLKERK
jgi:hypothetical protein